VLDPDAQSPAGHISHRHIQTDYTDPIGCEDEQDIISPISPERQGSARG